MVDVTTTNPYVSVDSGTVNVVDSGGKVISRRSYSRGRLTSRSGASDTALRQRYNESWLADQIATIKRAGYSSSEVTRRIGQARGQFDRTSLNPFEKGTVKYDFYKNTGVYPDSATLGPDIAKNFEEGKYKSWEDLQKNEPQLFLDPALKSAFSQAFGKKIDKAIDQYNLERKFEGKRPATVQEKEDFLKQQDKDVAKAITELDIPISLTPFAKGFDVAPIFFKALPEKEKEKLQKLGLYKPYEPRYVLPETITQEKAMLVTPDPLKDLREMKTLTFKPMKFLPEVKKVKTEVPTGEVIAKKVEKIVDIRMQPTYLSVGVDVMKDKPIAQSIAQSLALPVLSRTLFKQPDETYEEAYLKGIGERVIKTEALGRQYAKEISEAPAKTITYGQSPFSKEYIKDTGLFKPLTVTLAKPTEQEALRTGFAKAGIETALTETIPGIYGTGAVAGYGFSRILPKAIKIIAPSISKLGRTIGPRGATALKSVGKVITSKPVMYGTIGIPTAVETASLYQAGKPRKAFEKGIAGLTLLGGFEYGTQLAYRKAVRDSVAELERRLPKKEQKLFKEYMEKIEALDKTKVPVRKYQYKSFEGMDRFTPEARKGTLRFMNKYKKDYITGGSFAQRQQLVGKIEKQFIKSGRYKTSDIDFYVDSVLYSPKNMAKKYVNELKLAGANARLSKKGTEIYLTDAKGVSNKIAEFKTLARFEQNVFSVEKGLMPMKDAVVKTPEGIKILNLGTQAKRKLVAGYLEGSWGKHKDDFPKLFKSIQESARKGVIKELTKEAVVKKKLKMDLKNIFKSKKAQLSLTQAKVKQKIITKLKPSEFYHGTKPKYVKDILKKGLLPAKDLGIKGGMNKVFLTKDLELAKSYWTPIAKSNAVLKVKLTPAQLKKVVMSKEWGGTADLLEEYTFRGMIPPKQLDVVIEGAKKVITTPYTAYPTIVSKLSMPYPAVIPTAKAPYPITIKPVSTSYPSIIPTAKAPYPAVIQKIKTPYPTIVSQPKAPYPTIVKQPTTPYPTIVKQPITPYPTIVSQPKVPYPPIIPKTPKPPKTPTPIPIAIALPKGAKKTRKFKSFQTFVKRKGKYKKYGVPTTKMEALDLGTEFIDKSPSATFKLEPRSIKPSSNEGRIRGYFKKNRKKLRDYKIVKGTEMPMKNKYIELEKHRIDSKGETVGIRLKGLAKKRKNKFDKLLNIRKVKK